MRTINFHVQPRRASPMDLVVLSRLMMRAAWSPQVEMFSIHRDRKLNWINFGFKGPSVGQVWKILRSEVLNHRQWGPRLRRCSIVSCEGSRGWNNYLLLHHFKADQALDTLSASGNPRAPWPREP
jgi:hypothetical protein